MLYFFLYIKQCCIKLGTREIFINYATQVLFFLEKKCELLQGNGCMITGTITLVKNL